jgi:hypothetical protein
MLDRTRSRVDLRVQSVQITGRNVREKVVDRRVRSLVELERLVTHPEGSACLCADQTRWCVRSRATGRVRSREELSGLRSDARCNASGQTVKCIRSRQRLSLTRTAAVCLVVTLTGMSGHHDFHCDVL